MSRLPALATILVFLLGYALCAMQFPAIASVRVAADLLTDNAFLGIVAVGMTFVIISGGIDLSVGSVIGFTTVFLAVGIQHLGLPPLVAFAAVLGVCALFGAGMGAFILWLDMPPFIVTLAGMFLARGAAFLLSTESIPIDNPLYAAMDDHALRLSGGGRLGVVAVLMLAVFLIGGIVLRYTRFGMGVRALGGNRNTAGLMGLPAGRFTIGVYVLSSTLAGLAGIAFSLYTSSGYSLSAVGVELDSIAAVVIGGTLLSGGAGSVLGTFMGVLIQGLILTYINFDGTLSSWWAKIATGFLLFAFITFQQVSTGYTRRRLAAAR
jgi:ribose/xylose/arabinose/galactoside ABC-type transport system permease subunit